MERWDGIGGQMGLAGKKQAVVRKPRGTGAQKKAGSRATAKVNAAAGKTLEEYSDAIVKSLLDSTLGGNASSARLLFMLAEGQIDCEDEGMMRQLCSLAEKWASEPEWTGEVTEAVAETSFGQREPED